MIVNICIPTIEASKYLKHILLDLTGEIDNNTMIVEDFHTLLTSLNRSSRQSLTSKQL